MKSHLMITLAALAMAAAPAVSLAKDNGHGNGHGNSQRHSHGPNKAHPGHPHGMPPGQAKKMWSAGDRLPATYINQQRYYVSDPSRYQLPPAAYGYRYVRVGDQVYLAQDRTGVIRDVISNLLR